MDETPDRVNQLKTELTQLAQECQQLKEQLQAQTTLHDDYERILSHNQELSEALEETQRLDKVKNVFFANLSHELRTPLTLSISPLEMVLGQDPLDASVKPILQSVYNNQLRLFKMINELIDFAKLGAGQMTVSYQRENVVATLNQYLTALTPSVVAQALSLEVDLPDGSIELYLDHNKFEKIIMNLLSNAFKFTPKGGTIAVKLEDHPKFVKIVISDTGIGIAPERHAHLFERFASAHNAEIPTGTGIGLAMVKEYVQWHSGTIDVQSGLSQGATFSATFPKGKAHLDPELVEDRLFEESGELHSYQLIEFQNGRESENREAPTSEIPEKPALSNSEPSEPPKEPVTALPMAEEGGQERPSVLIVDDNAEMRQFLVSLLSPHYRLYVGKDGLEGLEQAQTHLPDLIITDALMPWVNGYELCQAVKSSEGRLRHTPVILLTGKADMSMKLEGLEYGADDYLVKPFNVDELTIRVKNLIKIRQQGLELYETMQALQEKKDALEQSLLQLKQTQTQLVQSEKMAALGQLVAGIAHEVNTPAAVIYSAISEMDQDYVIQTEQLINILSTLTPNQRELYLKTSLQILTIQNEISTTTQRRVAKNIRQKLSQHAIEDTRTLSKDLALIGISEDMVDPITPLFLTSEASRIHKAFRQLGMSHIRVKDIKIAIGRITQLVRALKHHSRSDSAEILETNLEEDLENTLVILHHKLKRAITVHKEYEAIPLVKCYANQLNQVWTNLIDNGIQAMKGEGTITLRLKNKGSNQVIVEVEDTGPGIPEALLPKIFDLYFTTKPKGEGTGLGLSICKEIIDRHHGVIKVTSIPGKTCFHITLPLSLES